MALSVARGPARHEGSDRLGPMSASYPSPARRTALIPAMIAIVALLVGGALITGDSFTVILFIVSILALIVSVFAWQARQWWWLIGLVPIAVLWNPVFPIDYAALGVQQLWFALQFVASIVFLAAGIMIKTVPAEK